MVTKERVLDHLMRSRGESISGEELAGELGVSRNAIWKAVRQLREEGHDISATTNRGYTLASSGDSLTAAGIAAQLTGPAACVRLDVRPEVTSTNTVLQAIAEAGEPEGYVLAAEQQTAGRGRLGRSFYSPPKTGVYVSLLLRPRFSAEESLFLTTAAAVAVAEAVEKASGKKAGIKWVNDVFIGEHKICGILTEASLDFETRMPKYAILGFGVNITQPKGGFPEEIRQVAASVFDADPPTGARDALVADILNRFFALYTHLERREFMPEYRRRSILIGKEIEFLENGRQNSGTALEIDGQARLVIRDAGGNVRALSSGEVTIRRIYHEKGIG